MDFTSPAQPYFMSFYISLVFLVLLLFWLIRIYNRFVQLKNQVDAAWSDISVQLKRRHDLIPKLVDMVRQYARYEETLLERITALRSEGKKLDAMNQPDLEKSSKIEKNLSEQLNHLLILVEDYPDLKASRHFMALQNELSRIEDTISHARRFYNGAVRLLNTRIDTFPDLLIARLFHFDYRQYFQLDIDT